MGGDYLFQNPPPYPTPSSSFIRSPKRRLLLNGERWAVRLGVPLGVLLGPGVGLVLAALSGGKTLARFDVTQHHFALGRIAATLHTLVHSRDVTHVSYRHRTFFWVDDSGSDVDDLGRAVGLPRVRIDDQLVSRQRNRTLECARKGVIRKRASTEDFLLVKPDVAFWLGQELVFASPLRLALIPFRVSLIEEIRVSRRQAIVFVSSFFVWRICAGFALHRCGMSRAKRFQIRRHLLLVKQEATIKEQKRNKKKLFNQK